MVFEVIVQSPFVLLIWACDGIAHHGWSAWWRTAHLFTYLLLVAARGQKEEAGVQTAP